MDVIGVEIKPMGHNSEGMVCIDVTVYAKNSIRSEDDGIGWQGGRVACVFRLSKKCHLSLRYAGQRYKT
jgi:hypothetical protein